VVHRHYSAPRPHLARYRELASAVVVLFRRLADLAPGVGMMALDLVEDFSGAPVAEGVLLLVHAHEENVAGEVIGKGFIVHGPDAHFEIADDDVTLAQGDIGGDHHGAEAGRG